jgi:hypothetical protein
LSLQGFFVKKILETKFRGGGGGTLKLLYLLNTKHKTAQYEIYSFQHIIIEAIAGG